MKKKYKWGEWLTPTKLAIEGRVAKKGDRGLFLGYHKGCDAIKVVIENHKTPYWYSPNFWARAKTTHHH